MNPSRGQKILSSVLALVFFISNGVLLHAAETNVWSERRRSQTQQLAALPSVSPLQPLTSPHTFISPKFGTIRSQEKSANVILIQDIHHNADAQKNIGFAIKELIENKKVDLIALEGDFDDIDLAPFKTFPYPDTIRKAANYLLRHHKISGPIHHALTSNKFNIPVVGVDDQTLYNANVKAVQNSAAVKGARQFENRKWQKEISLKKQTRFNSILLEFDRIVEQYRDKNLSFGDYLKALAKFHTAPKSIQTFLSALALEESINYTRVEQNRKRLLNRLTQRMTPAQTNELVRSSVAFRMGQITHHDFYKSLQKLCAANDIRLSTYPALEDYIHYVLLTKQIKADQLFNDMKQLEEDVYRTLAQTKDERALIAESRKAYLTGKLIEFALTKEEWKEYKDFHSSSPVGEDTGGGPTGRTGHLPTKWGGKEDLSSFENFYVHAEARDTTIARNLLNAMKEKKAKTAVLVSGGFHSDGIKLELQKENIQSMSFVPKVNKIESEKGSAYLSVFTQEKTPLEQLFKGKKLFLATQPSQGLLYELPFLSIFSHPNQASHYSDRFKATRHTDGTRILIDGYDHAVHVQATATNDTFSSVSYSLTPRFAPVGFDTSGLWPWLFRQFGYKGNAEELAVKHAWWMEGILTMSVYGLLYLWSPLVAAISTILFFSLVLHIRRVVILDNGQMATRWLWERNDGEKGITLLPSLHYLAMGLFYFGAFLFTMSLPLFITTIGHDANGIAFVFFLFSFLAHGVRNHRLLEGAELKQLLGTRPKTIAEELDSKDPATGPKRPTLESLGIYPNLLPEDNIRRLEKELEKLHNALVDLLTKILKTLPDELTIIDLQRAFKENEDAIWALQQSYSLRWSGRALLNGRSMSYSEGMVFKALDCGLCAQSTGFLISAFKKAGLYHKLEVKEVSLDEHVYPTLMVINQEGKKVRVAVDIASGQMLNPHDPNGLITIEPDESYFPRVNRAIYENNKTYRENSILSKRHYEKLNGLINSKRTPQDIDITTLATGAFWVWIIKKFTGKKNAKEIAVNNAWWIEGGLTISVFIWLLSLTNPFLAGTMALLFYSVFLHMAQLKTDGRGNLVVQWMHQKDAGGGLFFSSVKNHLLNGLVMFGPVFTFVLSYNFFVESFLFSTFTSYYVLISLGFAILILIGLFFSFDFHHYLNQRLLNNPAPLKVIISDYFGNHFDQLLKKFFSVDPSIINQFTEPLFHVEGEAQKSPLPIELTFGPKKLTLADLKKQSIVLSPGIFTDGMNQIANENPDENVVVNKTTEDFLLSFGQDILTLVARLYYSTWLQIRDYFLFTQSFVIKDLLPGAEILKRWMRRAKAIDPLIAMEAALRHIEENDGENLRGYVNHYMVNKGLNPRIQNLGKPLSAQEFKENLSRIQLWIPKEGTTSYVIKLSVHLKNRTHPISFSINVPRDLTVAQQNVYAAYDDLSYAYKKHPIGVMEPLRRNSVTVSTPYGEERVVLLIGEWVQDPTTNQDFQEFHEENDHIHVWENQDEQQQVALLEAESSQVKKRITQSNNIFPEFEEGKVNSGDFIGHRNKNGSWNVIRIWFRRHTKTEKKLKQGPEILSLKEIGIDPTMDEEENRRHLEIKLSELYDQQADLLKLAFQSLPKVVTYDSLVTAFKTIENDLWILQRQYSRLGAGDSLLRNHKLWFASGLIYKSVDCGLCAISVGLIKKAIKEAGLENKFEMIPFGSDEHVYPTVVALDPDGKKTRYALDIASGQIFNPHQSRRGKISIEEYESYGQRVTKHILKNRSLHEVNWRHLLELFQLVKKRMEVQRNSRLGQIHANTGFIAELFQDFNVENPTELAVKHAWWIEGILTLSLYGLLYSVWSPWGAALASLFFFSVILHSRHVVKLDNDELAIRSISIQSIIQHTKNALIFFGPLFLLSPIGNSTLFLVFLILWSFVSHLFSNTAFLYMSAINGKLQDDGAERKFIEDNRPFFQLAIQLQKSIIEIKDAKMRKVLIEAKLRLMLFLALVWKNQKEDNSAIDLTEIKEVPAHSRDLLPIIRRLGSFYQEVDFAQLITLLSAEEFDRFWTPENMNDHQVFTEKLIRHAVQKSLGGKKRKRAFEKIVVVLFGNQPKEQRMALLIQAGRDLMALDQRANSKQGAQSRFTLWLWNKVVPNSLSSKAEATFTSIVEGVRLLLNGLVLSMDLGWFGLTLITINTVLFILEHNKMTMKNSLMIFVMIAAYPIIGAMAASTPMVLFLTLPIMAIHFKVDEKVFDKRNETLSDLIDEVLTSPQPLGVGDFTRDTGEDILTPHQQHVINTLLKALEYAETNNVSLQSALRGAKGRGMILDRLRKRNRKAYLSA